MKSVNDIVIIIPCYNPDDKFIKFLHSLKKEGGYKHIIVVDDGSKKECQKLFDIAKEEYDCHIVKHYINLGQGRAFKSAFNYYLGNFANNPEIIGIIECDCDGQHVLEDINNCAKLLRENPSKLILGVRDFNDKKVPLRSRFGNKFTSFIFKAFCGLNIKDTQTGLKGMGTEIVKQMIEAPGERFEYASSMLLETKTKGIDILQFNIQTIYIDENKTSHFKPVIDSIRIYSLIFKYTLAQFSAECIDVLFFALFSLLLKGNINYILYSTYIARVISSTYTYLVNKKLIFKVKGNVTQTLIKWIILCVVQSTASGILTTLAVSSFKFIPVVVCKIIVDSILFFVSFQIQNWWIFRNKNT